MAKEFKIPWCKPRYWGNEKQYANEALNSMWISGGPYVDQLEKSFAHVHQTEYALTTSNGTTALQLALLGLDIQPKDEVIVPGFGFAAAANMVIAVGAKPVFVDVDKDTFLLSPQKTKEAITPATRAILPIHSYGNVCNMDQLLEVSKPKGIYMVEDVAEATFSKWNGNYAGTYSDVSAFSLHATKTITTGEGGMVLTRSQKLKEKMALIKSHGMAGKKYWHVCHAYNFRMTNFQAAVGVAQLEKVSDIVEERARVYSLYQKHLTKIDGIQMQKIDKQVDAVIWALPIVLQPGAFKFDRDEVMARLAEVGIETRPGFYTFEQMKLYESRFLENSDFLAKNIICLPFFTDLEEKEIQYITQEILKLKR